MYLSSIVINKHKLQVATIFACLFFVPILSHSEPLKYKQISVPEQYVEIVNEIQNELSIKVYFIDLPTNSTKQLFVDLKSITSYYGDKEPILLFIYSRPLKKLFVRATPLVELQAEFLHAVNRTIFYKVNKTITENKVSMEAVIELCVNAIKSSKTLYYEIPEEIINYKIVTGKALSTLNQISLNHYNYYEQYILKPVIIMCSLLLIEIGTQPYVLIIFSLLCYAFRKTILFPITSTIKFSKRYFFQKKVYRQKFNYQILAYMFYRLIDNTTKYLLIVPILAIVLLYTQPHMENILYIDYLTPDYLDMGSTLSYLPIGDNFLGLIRISEPSGIAIGITILILAYLYTHYGLKTLDKRYRAYILLNNTQFTSRYCQEIGVYGIAAEQVLENMRSTCAQPSWKGGGKYIQDEGYSSIVHFWLHGWKPVIKSIAIGLLPLPIGIYMALEEGTSALKAHQSYKKYIKILERVFVEEKRMIVEGVLMKTPTLLSIRDGCKPSLSTIVIYIFLIPSITWILTEVRPIGLPYYVIIILLIPIAIYLEIIMIATRAGIDKGILMMCYGNNKMLPKNSKIADKILNTYYKIILCVNEKRQERIVTKTTRKIIHCVIIADGIQRQIDKDLPNLEKLIDELVTKYQDIVNTRSRELSRSLLLTTEETSYYIENMIINGIRPVMIHAMDVKKALFKTL